MRTIEPVLGLFPDTKPEEWRQAGGWIHETASVDPTSQVQDDGIVGPQSVLIDTSVADRATVGPGCQMDHSKVMDDAKASDCRIESSIVMGTATIRAAILNNVRIKDAVVAGPDGRVAISNCTLLGGHWDEQPIAIQLDMMVSDCAPGRISIGCHDLSFEECLPKEN